MRVLRVVTLASRTGAYGGPFDTAMRQGRLARQHGIEYLIVAGHVRGDEIDASYVQTKRVSRWLPLNDYVALGSLSLSGLLWRGIRSSDVVHVSFARELIPLMASIMTIALRKPLVIQPHGMLTSRSSTLHRLADLIAKPIYQRAQRVIALTDVEAADLRTWCRASVHVEVIGNPADDVERVTGPSDTKPYALFAARLHPRKRVSTFIEAARLTGSSGTQPVDYVAVGPDQGEGHIAELAASQLSNFAYRGPVSSREVTLLTERAAVFVLPSANEPWGNALVTAIRAGIPVVVAESAALASTIREGNLGLVVPDGDARALSDAVERLASDASWWSADAVEARQQIVNQRFGTAAVGARIARLYANALTLT